MSAAGLLARLITQIPLVHIAPIAFVKTHKTASSTLANIFHRLGEKHDARFVLPIDSVRLGWPDEIFPGSRNVERLGPPEHQYDIIANHAVYDSIQMRAYLKPDPVFVTVLREPGSQGSSAFNYYRNQRVSSMLSWSGVPLNSWDDYLTWLEQTEPHGCDTVYFKNPQAHDMGWYQTVGQTSTFDNDDKMVQQWLKDLDVDFAHGGGVILTEYFDEGLIMLQRKLRIEFSDISYVRMKSTDESEKVLPTTEQLRRLREANNVDVKLYQHYNRTFWSSWQAAGGHATMGVALNKLRRLNSELETACEEPVDIGKCPDKVRMDSYEYTERLNSLSDLGPQEKQDTLYPWCT